MLKVPVILKFNTARENSRGLGNQTLSPGVGRVISIYLVIVPISVHGQRRNINIFRISMPLKLRLCDFKYVFKRFQFFRNRIIFLFRVRTCFMVQWDYYIIHFAFQVLILLRHTLSWTMCFRIKCEWTNHQNILTLTVLAAVDTTVTSFSLDLLAIAESIHGRCCKSQVAALFLRRSDRVKCCWKIQQFIHFFNYLWLSLR